MQNKKELLEEIQKLEKENKELITAIKKIDDRELFETVRIYTSMYQNAFYRKVPITFLETVFYTQKKSLLKHASGCLIETILDAAVAGFQNLKNPDLVMHIPMYCSNVIRLGSKTVFTLQDPYRTITTLPICSLSEEDAFYCKGKMLIAKLVIPEDHRAKKSFELRGFVPLKMTLTNVFGKEVPTNYYTLFTQFKDIHNEKDAQSALNIIETYYSSHSNTNVLRVNENTLRITDGRKKIAVSFEKDQMWYGEETSSIPILFNNDGINQGTIFDNDYNNYLFQGENLL